MIDCQWNYIGEDAPITEQQARWPAGGGARAWEAVRTIERLVPAARAAGVPVIYTRNVQKRTTRFDMVSQKAGWDHTRTLDENRARRSSRRSRRPKDDIVIDKAYASAFWATPLLTYLVNMRVDSVIVAGVSTSGCVRATAVDAASHGFRPAVVPDAVADRIQLSHAATLLDLWMKYADLMSVADVETYVAGLSKQAAVRG